MSVSDDYARGRRAGRGRGVLLRTEPHSRAALDLPNDGLRRLPLPIPEAALYPAIADHFASQAFACWREASFLGSWIDVYCSKADEAVAVEAKVVDWRRALRQAILLRNSAHRVYVAVWAPYVHRALTGQARRGFEEAGVGLLSVNGHCEELIEAAQREPRYPESVLVSASSRVR